MRKNMKRKKLIPLFIILMIIFTFVSYNFINKIITFNEHRKYFEQPIEDQVVKSWMSLNFLQREYSMNIEEIFPEKLNFWEKDITIKQYCDKYEVNCEELIIKLENIKNGN